MQNALAGQGKGENVNVEEHVGEQTHSRICVFVIS